MNTRRPAGRSDETAMKRLAARAEEDRQVVERGFAAVMEGMEDLRAEIRRGAQNTGLLAQKVDNLEFQLNLTRDEVQRRAIVPAPSQIESARAAIKHAAKSWPAKVVAIAVGFTAIMVALNNIPDAARAWDRVWVFVRGADQPEAKVDAKAGT